MCVRHTLQNDVIMHGLHISLHSSLQIFSALTHLFQLSQVSQQFQSKASYMVLAVEVTFLPKLLDINSETSQVVARQYICGRI